MIETFQCLINPAESFSDILQQHTGMRLEGSERNSRQICEHSYKMRMAGRVHDSRHFSILRIAAYSLRQCKIGSSGNMFHCLVLHSKNRFFFERTRNLQYKFFAGTVAYVKILIPFARKLL